MKIALVVPGGVDRSGRERVIPAVLNLIERLARRHTVHVVALEQEPDYARYSLLGATVTNLGRGPGSGLGVTAAMRYRRLLKVLRDDGPFDLAHVIWANAVAAMAARRCGIPLIVSIGGGEFANIPEIQYGGQLRWRSRRQIQYCVEHAAAVTAGSKYVLQQSGRRDAQWLPLGVDATAFVSASAPPDPRWRLLQVASINRVKDQFTALRALRILVDRGLDVEFDIVGEDTLAGTLARLAAELSITGQVHFPGFRANGDLAEHYGRTHVYVQSSLHESQGVSVLEAAASGLAIVGTEVGLLAELAPGAAVSVPVADPVQLADAIQRVLENPELRAHLGRNARKFAATYNADWTCSRFEHLYAQVIAGHPAKAPRVDRRTTAAR